MNLKEFNKATCKVLYLVQSNPHYQYRFENEWIEVSPTEVVLGKKL